MEYVALGRSNLLVSRIAFGAYGLQDVSSNEYASTLVQQAYTGGINFFDTTHSKSQSEKMLGYSIQDIRENIILSTRTSADTPKLIQCELDESLTALNCDYIDLYQLENLSFVPKENSSDGIYKTLKMAKENGKIRHIGYCTDSFQLAKEAIESKLYETIQFPFNMLVSNETWELVKLCEQHDVGFLAMQPLCGGIITDIPLAYGFFQQFENVIPLWGIQTEEELQQILYFQAHPPIVDEKFKEDEEKIRSFFA